MQKKKIRKVNRRPQSRIFIGSIVLLSLLLIALLFIEFDLKNFFEKLSKKPELFVIQDKCSLIFKNIIHQIRDKEECSNLCRNECSIRDKKIHSSEFIESNSSCHTCNCYCR
jgi:hypothetical protein